MAKQGFMKWITCFFLTACLLTACAQPFDFQSPKGYDLQKPEETDLEDDLLEISGIAWHEGKFYAIQDENGRLFFNNPGTGKWEDIKFAKGGDYEDLAIANNHAFVLRSDGTVFSFALPAPGFIDSTLKEHKEITPKGEYESMYIDVTKQQLYILCKSCKGDNKQETISGYQFPLIGDSIGQPTNFSLNEATIKQLIKEKKGKTAPSAMALHPLLNEWYIVSSQNKLLIVANREFSVKAVYHLNPKHYGQPEGICFDPQGNLYISNEGDGGRPGNIQKLPYKP